LRYLGRQIFFDGIGVDIVFFGCALVVVASSESSKAVLIVRVDMFVSTPICRSISMVNTEMKTHLGRGMHTAKLAIPLLEEFADRHLDG
jgi:hypothetical protein